MSGCGTKWIVESAGGQGVDTSGPYSNRQMVLSGEVRNWSAISVSNKTADGNSKSVNDMT